MEEAIPRGVIPVVHHTEASLVEAHAAEVLQEDKNNTQKGKLLDLIGQAVSFLSNKATQLALVLIMKSQ